MSLFRGMCLLFVKLKFVSKTIILHRGYLRYESYYLPKQRKSRYPEILGSYYSLSDFINET